MTRHDETFDKLRGHAFRVGYQMLGSAADAEDLVQEAWIRWKSVEHDAIESPRAWITTVVTRLAMNHLASARVKREQYVGTWLPEPVGTGNRRSAQEAVELDESISLAFLWLLESLTPKERAVFLLHEVFDLPHARIADIVGVSDVASRQLLHRARTELRARRPRFETSPEAQARLLEGFRAASGEGDLDALMALLAEDVVVYTDGGGRARAALRPIHGRDHAARFVHGAVSKFVPDGVANHVVEINGSPGLVASANGDPIAAISLEVADGLIQALFIVTNPDKLRAIAGGVG